MTTVLVGVITHAGEQHCRDIFFKYLQAISTSVSFVIVTNSGEEDRKDLERRAEPLKKKGTVAILSNEKIEERLDQIVSNRNVVREYFLNGTWEYLYFLDSDLIGPTNAIDALRHHNHNLVTGWYLGVFDSNGKPVIRPVAYAFHSKDTVRQLSIKDVVMPRFLRIVAAGLGCCLIHRTILEQVIFRRHAGSEDAVFFKDAREKCGEELWLDTRVAYWHLKLPLTDERVHLYDPRKYMKLGNKKLGDKK